MRIILLEGDRVIRDRTLEGTRITIGSDFGSGVHLPDLGIALEHARLVVSHTGQWQLETSAATGGTLVNGRQVEKRFPVHNGDEIVISRYRLKIAVDGHCDLGVTGPSSLEELTRIKDFPLPPGGEVRRPDAPMSIPPDRQLYLAGLARQLWACDDLEAVLDQTLSALLEALSARLAWCGIRRQPTGKVVTVEGRTPDGPTTREPQALASLEYRCLERGQSLLLARKKSLTQESGLAVPLEAQRGRLGLLYVEARPDQHRYQAHHLDLLLAVASLVAARVEDVLVGIERTHAAVTADGGAWLRAVQARINPSSVPRWPGYQLAIYCRPGRDRGGDLYNCITMPNGMASLLVANVQADALGTAILLPEVRAAFRVGGMHADPPRVLLQELNWLAGSSRGGCGLYAAHVVMNPKTGALEFCTAGPVGALIIDAHGALRTLTDTGVDSLGSGKTIEFPRRSERLGPGEMLVLYTPGCGTICDAQGQELGDDRFIEGLRDGFGVPPTTLLEDLRHDLAGFFKDGRQPDDITILLLYRP